ncbi:MAG: hypothetical protein LDL30_05760 [Desulfovibrio sp.]|nr:hypothetical protein [Desulfovibrio sp.]MCA1985242.1 hypothetical protein [Desulfovibrio sp.]
MRALILAGLLTLFSVSSLWAFSFSQAERQDQMADQARADQIMTQLSTPCRNSLKGQKIAVLIAERHGGNLRVGGGSHGLLHEALNARLQALGLQTYSQAQINAQVAAAQIRAVLNNDPDAALSASSRLGAAFFLKGVISSRANQAMSMNVKGAQMNVNDVSVTIQLTLTRGAKLVSHVSATQSSWAGADTMGVALDIVERQSASLIAQLYQDFCTQGGK